MKQSQTIGNYVLHFHPLQLWEGRRMVDLTSRQLTVLAILVRARGRVVTKETFFEQIWHGVSVEEGNLTQSIFLLRRALGRMPDGQEYILTLPRKGYCINIKALQTDDPAEPETWDRSLGAGVTPYDQYRALVNSVEDCAMYMLDCTGRVTSWNPGAEVIFGFTQQEAIGQHFSSFFTPEDGEAHVPKKHIAAATREHGSSGEMWRLRKNGERFWAYVSLSAMRGATGNLLGYSETVRDLTERRRLEDSQRRREAALRRERDQLRSAVDSMADALLLLVPVWDEVGEPEDFAISYANPIARRLLGLIEDDPVGANLSRLMPAEVSSAIGAASRSALRSGEPAHAQCESAESEDLRQTLRVRAVSGREIVTVLAGLQDLRSPSVLFDSRDSDVAAFSPSDLSAS